MEALLCTLGYLSGHSVHHRLALVAARVNLSHQCHTAGPMHGPHGGNSQWPRVSGESASGQQSRTQCSRQGDPALHTQEHSSSTCVCLQCVVCGCHVVVAKAAWMTRRECAHASCMLGLHHGLCHGSLSLFCSLTSAPWWFFISQHCYIHTSLRSLHVSVPLLTSIVAAYIPMWHPPCRLGVEHRTGRI